MLSGVICYYILLVCYCVVGKLIFSFFKTDFDILCSHWSSWVTISHWCHISHWWSHWWISSSNFVGIKMFQTVFLRFLSEAFCRSMYVIEAFSILDLFFSIICLIVNRLFLIYSLYLFLVFFFEYRQRHSCSPIIRHISFHLAFIYDLY